MRTDEIDNKEDVIDSRDVIARIRELESERESLESALQEAKDALSDPDPESAPEGEELEEAADAVAEAGAALDEFDDSDEGQELKALLAFQEEAEGYAPDWNHGATLIRDSYFEDYARQLADDLHGRGVRDAEWPFTCIDWEAAADELKQDYTSAEFDGVTYWVR